MADKLIDLSRLQVYKSYADAKYQDKLTAGSNISINDNTISKIGAPIYSYIPLDDQLTTSGTTTSLGEVTLQPGIYVLMYTVTFHANTSGYRRIGFSTGTRYLDGFGAIFQDSQAPTGSSITTQTMVTAIFDVSATSYPNGRTFYFLAYQNSGSTLTAYPRAYYLKF